MCPREKPKLHGLFTFYAAPLWESQKVHYFWRTRHELVDNFEESEQLSQKQEVELPRAREEKDL